MCYDNLADESEISPEGQMPWCTLIRNDIAKMIVKNINDLIVRDSCLVRPSC